jgi:hypothetical protein
MQRQAKKYDVSNSRCRVSLEAISSIYDIYDYDKRLFIFVRSTCMILLSPVCMHTGRGHILYCEQKDMRLQPQNIYIYNSTSKYVYRQLFASGYLTNRTNLQLTRRECSHTIGCTRMVEERRGGV